MVSWHSLTEEEAFSPELRGRSVYAIFISEDCVEYWLLTIDGETVKDDSQSAMEQLRAFQERFR